MAVIRCKACGKTYRYEKEGCCPECGAYNRPPRREQVNADGSIRHMTDADYERRSSAGDKICFEQKEHHGEKVCYEDQARQWAHEEAPAQEKTAQPRRSAALNKSAARPVSSAARGTRKRSGCLPSLLIVAVLLGAVIAVFNAVTGSVRESFNDIGNIEDLPFDDIGNLEENGEISPVWTEARMGETFALSDGTEMRVIDWSRDSEAGAMTVHVELDSDREPPQAVLYCIDPEEDPGIDGEEYVLEKYEFTADSSDGQVEGWYVFPLDGHGPVAPAPDGGYGFLEPLVLLLTEEDDGIIWVDMWQ
ncbi:MAG: hydrogenase maturation nickel metallochaperone HypA [Ruminococcaceae bacterium]|jgi:hypothetical protein|nr:hydrogenase maturation nickel metallochaperone HypA [Oscillospiraceae bacterium]